MSALSSPLASIFLLIQAIGAGQNEPHAIDEWINLDEYDRACVLAVQLATMR
jgi:hypothetical protein